MKQSLLVAALLAVAVSACGKKEEAPAVDTTNASIEASAPMVGASPVVEASASVSVAPVVDASAPPVDAVPAN